MNDYSDLKKKEKIILILILSNWGSDRYRVITPTDKFNDLANNENSNDEINLTETTKILNFSYC